MDVGQVCGVVRLQWLCGFAWDTVWTASTHWFLIALFVLLIAAMAGWLGRGLGVHNLFNDDPQLVEYNNSGAWGSYLNSPTLFTPAAIMVYACFTWSFAYLLGDRDGGAVATQSFGPTVGGQVALSGLVLMLAGMRWRGEVLGPSHLLNRLRFTAGVWLGVGFGSVAVVLGWLIGRLLDGPLPTALAELMGIVLVAIALVAFALRYRKLIVAVSLVSAISLTAVGYVVISVFPDRFQIWVLVVGVLLLIAQNGGKRQTQAAGLKMQFPGIVAADGSDHYEARKNLKEYFAAKETGSAPSIVPGPLAPLATLHAWLPQARLAQRVEKPKLVVIATSGGAYRAGFWTAMVLDRLATAEAEGALTGFSSAVRLITGASGGMVGGAYFAARAKPTREPNIGTVTALSDDIMGVQGGTLFPDYVYATKWPIPRDSLSAVAQQLVQRDLPGLLRTGTVRIDRGLVLEDQWHTLGLSFAQMREGESNGWRPSLLFSPMLAETGQPLLISNLDMAATIEDRVRGGIGPSKNEVVEFFDLFPHSRGEFRVKTAVRMNASFPYISPDVALPTDPYRRVVDAGYYDNYGVDLASAFLGNADVREWLLQNCSGVAVVQIRAFPPPAADAPEPVGLPRALQWLSTPIDSVLSARSATMLYRNRQTLHQVSETYNTPSPGFFLTVAFQAACDTSLNWYLPMDELAALRAEFEPVVLPTPRPTEAEVLGLDQRTQNQFWLERLGQFWCGTAAMDPAI